MLVAARAQAAQGVSVLAGIVETHGRRETASLLEGLAVLPLKDVAYRGHMLKEFDLDGALAARPGLVLVDELAHSNAPGSRHAKRWQDIQELLSAGIDVWTTLNVQHLGQPERSGGQHHRRARLGDRARRGLRRRRRSHPGGPVGRRTAAAIEGRQGLPARTGPPRHPQFLPQGQPDRLARTGAAPHRRPRRRRRPGLSARPRDRTRLAHPRSRGRLHRSGHRRRIRDPQCAPAEPAAGSDLHVVTIDTPRAAPTPQAEQDRMQRSLALADSLGARTETLAGGRHG